MAQLRMRWSWIGAAWMFLAVALALPARAAEGEQLLQQELKQQQIKTTTQRVAGQLAQIITEFERNAIEGEDVRVLRAISSVLGRLAEKDMARVVALLQQARDATDPAAATRHGTDAYAGQRGIITQLQQLVLEYQRQQALYELSLRFKEYARRQTANMWMGVGLAKETDGRGLGSFNETQQSSLRVQQIDEENLREEIRAALIRLEKIAAEPIEGPGADRPKLAMQQAKEGGLSPALDKAVEDLKNGKLLSATGNEKRARDQLREISRLLLLAQGDVEALRQALRELEKAIDTQRAVAADTRQIEKKDPRNVQPRQAELVDAADLVRRDVESMAPVAAEHLKEATESMQEARQALSAESNPDKQREKAPPLQDKAVARMEDARQALRDQIQKAEQLASFPEQNLDALRELQAQVRQVIEEEQKLKTDAAAKEAKMPMSAARQGELGASARQLQQKAAAPAPAAALSIGEAAGHMQNSQESLAAGKNDPPAQQAAIDALQRADQQLAQEIERLEKAQQQLAQVEELAQKLGAVIQDQEKVRFATAKEALKPKPADLPGLTGRQTQLEQQAGELQKESAAPVPAAEPLLGKAAGHMDEAGQQLEKAAPKDAQPKQGEALVDLYAARREVDKKMNELREQLGLAPKDNTQSLADAAARIEQAQQQVAQAMSEIQQSPPGLMESLRQQQKHIAEDLGKASQKPDAAPAVAEARDAAAQAAQALTQPDLPKAVESMKKAQQAMEQAKASQPTPMPEPAKDQPTLPQLAQEQQEVREVTEALVKQMQNASQSALQQAEKSLSEAGEAIMPLAAGQSGQIPGMAQSALESAQNALANGAAQASAQQGMPAQASADQAQQALAQAQAALALAQNGMNTQGMPGQGQQQAQKSPGQSPGQQGSPGQGQGQAQASSRTPGSGQGTPNPQGSGRQGNWRGQGGANGPRRATAGPGNYTRLPARDRAAILQSQTEKYPQEYGPMVEQYLKNLSDQSGK